MLKNYLLVALRGLRAQRGTTLLNVVGLAVGLACALLTGLYVRHELSYDRFHEHADRIVRVAKDEPGSEFMGTSRYALTPAPLAEALMRDVPEVERAAQVQAVEALLGTDPDTRAYRDGLFATRQFFDVFTFDLLDGDPATALAEPNSVVLTASTARAYFGDTNPLGQTLDGRLGDDAAALTVTGIVAEAPSNSHLAFDFLLAMTTSEYYTRTVERDRWGSSDYHTYALLRPDATPDDLTPALDAFAQTYIAPLDFFRENPERLTVFFTQPLTDLHLRSDLNFELGVGGSERYVWLVAAIGVLILLLACVNYTNLATARGATRAQEVGVRKVLGAGQAQLAGQFLTEALLVTFVALGLAVALAQAALPTFSDLVARDLSLAVVATPAFWGMMAVLGLVVGVLAGGYPSLVLARLQPARAMQGSRPGRGRFFRNSLVVGQFAVTTALLAGTLAVHQQVRYVQTARTGLDRAQVVALPLEDRATVRQYDALKETLHEHTGVLAVTASQHSPTRIIGQSGMTRWEGVDEGERVGVFNSAVRPGFVDAFGLEIVEGRDFIEGHEADNGGALINETLARELGWETAVGRWIDVHGWEMPIVGVVKDFNFLSFRQPVAPLALYNNGNWVSRLLVKVDPTQVPETLDHLEATMATAAPAYPFTYEFVDDAYARMYADDVQLGRLFGVLTALALLVAGLGLVGLTTFMTAQRTKEIGIRKVLGATVAQIVALISADLVKLVVLAFVIAAPVAYVGLRRWLDDFVYRIELGPGLFLVTGFVAIALTLLAVSVHALRAATADPVRSLRYE
ncbi:MAG: ABC transporter permease [Bacteroidota bacterium]